jgi:ribosomal protein L11 methylase PrmA
LKWEPIGTDWSGYYQDTNYSEAAFEQKKSIVRDILREIQPNQMLDLGANTGEFSRLGLETNDCFVISTDIDPGAVEQNYLQVRDASERNILPLVIDLTNPSPSIGWKNQERTAFLSRAKADVVLTLALIHHLAITNNIPFESIAKTLVEMADHAIVEFVPKSDSQVKRLLATRDDIFTAYSIEGFISAVNGLFTIQDQIPIEGTQRVIFHLKKKTSD